jgi:hypothetical protein
VKDELTGRRIASIDKIVYDAVEGCGTPAKHGMKISDIYGI